MRTRWLLQSGRTHRRHRWRDSRCSGTKPQLLKSFRIQFSRGIQSVRFLKFSGCFNRRIVPLPVRLSREGTIFSKRLLNLGNALGSGSFLPPLPATCFFRRLRAVRRAARLGSAGLLWRRRRRLRRSSTNTQPRRYKKRQGQVIRVSRSHS